MAFPLWRVVILGVGLGCLQGNPAQAAGPEGSLYFNPAGEPGMMPRPGWELTSRSQRDGKRILEYQLAIDDAAGAKALVRVTLWQLARSIKIADLTPQEVEAVERGRDAAFKAREQEVDTLPGVRFLSGGTQFTYTALEHGRRFSYVHFVGVTGVPDARTELSPAVAIDLRCRNAVDEDATQHAVTAAKVEAICHDLMLNL